MSWEQHRYAVERAARARRDAADRINEESKMVTLQGEGHGSDAEMLEEVAEFLQSLEGSKPGAWMEDAGKAFMADWAKAMRTMYVFAGQYDLPAPDMIFHPKWMDRIRSASREPIYGNGEHYGIRFRFGQFERCDVIRP